MEQIFPGNNLGCIGLEPEPTCLEIPHGKDNLFEK